MISHYYQTIALIVITFWIAGVGIMLVGPKKCKALSLASFLIIFGTFILSLFIIVLWVKIGRPPMRTLGETRLWYGLFMAITGIVLYYRWKYKWFIFYCLVVASLFLAINIAYPENFSKTLMPALQSIWFIPHVIVYIVAYALLAASSIVAIKGLYIYYYPQSKTTSIISLADNIVYIGFSFLTMGLIFGALWAKEAWGHYWTWDPKETWAFLSWAAYLIYIHARVRDSLSEKKALWILAISFIILLLCWFGVNYMPSTTNSVHTYS